MECQQCGLPIPEGRLRRHAKFCSQNCLHSYQAEQFRKANPKPRHSSATTGAISEYRVTIDLLNKGYEVFRSVSPACSCDLAVLKDGHLLTIEVRTRKYSASGKAYTSDTKPVRADIAASVFYDKITYKPELT